MATIVLVIALFLAVNVLSAQLLTRFRLDLTENRLYTLSEQVISTLESLDEPISLRLFISRSEVLNSPGLSTYASRVEDLLREFEQLSNGRITYSIVDPEAFSEAEDTAVGYGLQGIPLASGGAFYFGLVASNSTDGVQTIPHFFLEREELLEYDLVRLIVQLDGRLRKKIGLLSSLPIQGAGGLPAGARSPQNPWTFFLQLNEIFDVKLLSPSIDALPDDIEMLFLLHPRNLSDGLLYEIDQFVMKGNSLLLVVDPHSEALSSILASTQLSEHDAGSNLNQLTDHWGVVVKTGKIVGDLPIAARVLEGDGSSGRTIDYPVWMNVQPEQLNPLDVVTAKLGNLIFATAGILEINADLKTDITTLIRTSESAKLYDVSEFRQISSVRELSENYQEGRQRWPLAVRIGGRAVSAFAAGPPAEAGSLEASQAHATHIESGEINVIVIADSDFLQDRFWVRTHQIRGRTLQFAEASNGEFIHNAIDNLSGANSLIGVRTRGRSFRPFVRTQQIRRAAEQKYRQHEEKLHEELKRIEEFLANFQEHRSESTGKLIISDREREEVKRLRENQISIRAQLREVRHNLVKDIQQLEKRLLLLNVLAVPLLLAVAGTAVCTIGVKKRGRRLAVRIREQLG